MAQKQVSAANRNQAKEYGLQGIQAYEEWDIDRAIECFETAARLDPEEADYLLYMARVLARSGDYDQALKSLAHFMRLEPDSPLADRFEQLFASGMDEVESLLTEKMTEAGMPIEQIGVAIQMWLEYRIVLGRQKLNLRKPATWAAAIEYTVRKVNLYPTKRRQIADFYQISDRGLRDRHEDLINELDVMPCDYRYFTGEKNPLDKLVEAAELLEELETRFREP